MKWQRGISAIGPHIPGPSTTSPHSPPGILDAWERKGSQPNGETATTPRATLRRSTSTPRRPSCGTSRASPTSRTSRPRRKSRSHAPIAHCSGKSAPTRRSPANSYGISMQRSSAISTSGLAGGGPCGAVSRARPGRHRISLTGTWTSSSVLYSASIRLRPPTMTRRSARWPRKYRVSSS